MYEPLNPHKKHSNVNLSWIVLGLIIFLIIGYIVLGNSQTFKLPNNPIVKENKLHICQEKSNEKVEMLNQKYSPKTSLSLMEYKDFNNMNDALGFISKWKTSSSLSSSSNTERAIEAVNKNSNSSIHIASIKAVFDDFISPIEFYFFVCNDTGDILVDIT